MTAPVVTYATAKAALAAADLPTASGSAWQGEDQESYRQFVAAACYNAGVPIDQHKANYGFAYPGEMPAAVANAVGEEDYSVTIAATPLSGAHPLSVTATATETGGPASNYNWNFGDGTIVNTTVPNATHSYAAAGTFTVKMTPTVDGIIGTQVSAPAPVVVS